MKDRIMQYLNDFANNKASDLAHELQEELKLSATEFQQRALEVQSSILHDYGNFSISTIDAFFQRVIRSFTYEAGISGDYRLEVDKDPVMEEVIANLVEELGSNTDLTNWVVELALQKLEDDKPWDMRQGLMEFSNELFRDEFKLIEDQVAAISNKDFLSKTKNILQKKKYEFTNVLKSKAREILNDIRAHHFTIEDFVYKKSGIYGFLEKFSEGNVFGDVGSRVQSCMASPEDWVSKTHFKRKEIMKAAERWMPQLNDLVDYRNKNIKAALSAEEALKNFYSFGLITDISRKLIEYKKENNLMLLSDAPQFLNKIISDSDTPFVYEKAGSFYKNFLIDEFQDTSAMQWKNFLPLVTNNLDSGYPSLVVGDVKQSIYRWRGGDKNLLQHNIYSEIGNNRIQTQLLNRNFRSSSSVVSFNNELFKSAAERVAAQTGTLINSEEYKDVEQVVTREQDGFVHARFFEDKDLWKNSALAHATNYVEQLQKLGAAPGDIAFLVRKKEEGKQIIAHLLERKAASPVEGVVYDVVSSESLLIAGASVVNFLIAALRYLHNPDNDIARAQLAYENTRYHKQKSVWSEVFEVTNQFIFEGGLPSEFASRKIQLRKLPLFELVENLIHIFNLENTDELPYLLGFQDAILEFVTRERNDLGAFLDWWEDQKSEKSIVAPSGSSAMQLMTIHKAKGLQFKYVVIPFCTWNMDHDNMKRPNLWVKSNESFFKDIGYVPVRYSSKLEDTFFAEAYQQEHSNIFLDNLNLLYVAFTRAEFGLALFGQAGSKNSTSQLVIDSITSSPTLQEKWNSKDLEWKSEELSIEKPENQKQEKVSSSLPHYPVSDWREKLVIKKSGWSELTVVDESRAKILQGIYIHAALSSVRYANDIPSALKKLVDDGSVTLQEKANLENVLNGWMGNALIADWFSSHWNVQTEATVLLQDGNSVRFDRLLTQGKKARVIDFKTGNASKKDQTQVSEYCELLRTMGFDAEGYLLYLTDGEVVQVGKKKPEKKKSTNQLGLDF